MSHTQGGNPQTGKSLDFYWHSYDIDVYAMHKHTRQSGGSQDGQFKEVLEMMQRFQRSNEKNAALIIIGDGGYYTADKLAGLNRYRRDQRPKCFACNIGDIPSLIKQL